MAKNKKRTGEENACPMRKTSIGGQALMEGIMMRGPKLTAMAVRNTQGEIVVESFPTTTSKRPAILRWPIIRGVLGFVDSMSLGYKCLMRSAEISGLEEIEAEIAEEKAQKKAAKAAKKEAKKGNKASADVPSTEPAVATAEVDAIAADTTDSVEKGNTAEASETLEPTGSTATVAPTPPTDKKQQEKKTSGTTTAIMVVSMVLAFAIAFLAFFLLPTHMFEELSERISWLQGNNRYIQSIFESVVRVILLVGYMSLMLLMKDIRRTFRFHGAEHKTIFCYEKGLELTVENVRLQRRFHPRCGTSFLILMVLVGILIGFLIPPELNQWVRAAVKVLLLPLTMGVGYELIKLCGRYDNWLTRIVAAPGILFQRITVWEPDDSMIECAIAAVKEVIPEDGSDQIK